MSVAILLLTVSLCAADGVDDEARIEQLIHQHAATVKLSPAKTASAKAAAKSAPDPAAASVGHKVRIHTVERGLYVGTLQTLDANNAVLLIDLPGRALSYTVARSGIAQLEDLEPAP